MSKWIRLWGKDYNLLGLIEVTDDTSTDQINVTIDDGDTRWSGRVVKAHPQYFKEWQVPDHSFDSSAWNDVAMNAEQFDAFAKKLDE